MNKKIRVFLVLLFISLCSVGMALASESEKGSLNVEATNESNSTNEANEVAMDKDNSNQLNKEIYQNVQVDLKNDFQIQLPNYTANAESFSSRVLDAPHSGQIVDIVMWTEDKVYKYAQEKLVKPQGEVYKNIVNNFFTEGTLKELEISNHPAIYHEYESGKKSLYIITEDYGFAIFSEMLSQEEMFKIAESIDFVE